MVEGVFSFPPRWLPNVLNTSASLLLPPCPHVFLYEMFMRSFPPDVTVCACILVDVLLSATYLCSIESPHQ